MAFEGTASVQYIEVTPWQSVCRLYKVEGLAKNVLAGLVRQPDKSRVPHGPTLWQQHARLGLFMAHFFLHLLNFLVQKMPKLDDELF